MDYLFIRALRPNNKLKSYQEGDQLVTVHTHGDFIVLSYCTVGSCHYHINVDHPIYINVHSEPPCLMSRLLVYSFFISCIHQFDVLSLQERSKLPRPASMPPSPSVSRSTTPLPSDDEDEECDSEEERVELGFPSAASSESNA